MDQPWRSTELSSVVTGSHSPRFSYVELDEIHVYEHMMNYFSKFSLLQYVLMTHSS